MDQQTNTLGSGVALDQPSSSSRPTMASPPRSPWEFDPHPRLSLHTPNRILVGTFLSGTLGFSLGALQGGQMAQLRFRAEHAHKMPSSTAGWYLYHKTKNYHAMQGGIREGFAMSAKTAIWSCMALCLESSVDGCRGSSDMFSTIIATVTVAGGFSLWRKLSPYHAPVPHLFLQPVRLLPLCNDVAQTHKHEAML